MNRPLAPGFDPAARRLEQDGKIGGNEIGPFREQPAQTVVLVGDLLAVVEHEGDVSFGLTPYRRRQAQKHREPALHVGRAQPVHRIASRRGFALPLAGTVSR